MSIIPPIILSDFGDLSIYSTIKKAENDVEVFDLDDYEVFDSRGKKLEFAPVNIHKSGFWVYGDGSLPKILEPEKEIFEREKLSRLIIRYLKNIKTIRKKPFIQKEWEYCSLEELVKELGNNILDD